MKRWTDDFFNTLYWELFMKRTDEQIQSEVDFITRLIGFQPQSVMDVCCGVGDILSGFAKNNAARTLGVEFSQDYVNRRYIQSVIKADACEKQTSEQFDLVMNWFSSFAYFDKSNNKQMLRNCFDATGKVFIMEMYNAYGTLFNFKELIEYDKKLNGKIYHIKRQAHVDVMTRCLCQKWTFSEGENTWSYDTSTQMYFADEIISLLKEVGFQTVELFSRENNELTPLDFKSPRIIVRAKR